MKLKFNEEYHSYWIDGRRAKGVTTIAKIPDDTYNLERWAERQVAIGLACTPSLVESVAAHIDDKRMLNGFCWDAKKAAGAFLAADRGVAAHRITERHDGGDQVIPTPLALATVKSWSELLDACDLEVVPEYMERIVVYPNLMICGKYDRFLRRRSTGQLVCSDLKTGERAIQYPHAIAVQLALYANAPIMAESLPTDGGETETFEELPELDMEWGIILHLPENGPAQAVEVNIAAGWETFQTTILRALSWRERKDLIRPLSSLKAQPVVMPADPALVDKLRAEVLWIKETSPAGLAAIANDWPDGVPTFTQGGPTNADQTALLAMLVERVKRDHNVPFNPADNPEPVAVPERVETVVEVPRQPYEGEDVEVVDRDALAKSLSKLPDDQQAWIGYIAKQAHEAGAGISVKQRPTQRRFEIARGLIILAPHGEDELLRALVALTVDDDSLTSPALPAGAVVASLGAVEAAAFAALCEQYAGRGLPTVVGEDNRLRVQRAA